MKRILVKLLFWLLDGSTNVVQGSEDATMRRELARLHTNLVFQEYLFRQDMKLRDRLAGGVGLTPLPPLDYAVLLGQRKQIAFQQQNMRDSHSRVRRKAEESKVTRNKQ